MNLTPASLKKPRRKDVKGNQFWILPSFASSRLGVSFPPLPAFDMLQG